MPLVDTNRFRSNSMHHQLASSCSSRTCSMQYAPSLQTGKRINKALLYYRGCSIYTTRQIKLRLGILARGLILGEISVEVDRSSWGSDLWENLYISLDSGVGARCKSCMHAWSIDAMRVVTLCDVWSLFGGAKTTKVTPRSIYCTMCECLIFLDLPS
jgi:hypothetical protein